MKPIAAACLILFLMLSACSGWRPKVEANAPKPAAAAPTPAPASESQGHVPQPMPPSPSTAAPVAADSQVANNAPAVAKTATPASAAKSKQLPPPAAPRPAPAVPGGTVAAKAPAASEPVQRPPPPPPLDIAALEQRLKDTHAIGIFTKLSLKNQVDDLLAQFRAHYRGNGSPPLTELRQRYDLLMLKVLSLLQDGDPPLAQTIGSSREAIWRILTDPNKLAAISS